MNQQLVLCIEIAEFDIMLKYRHDKLHILGSFPLNIHAVNMVEFLNF